MRGDTKFSNFWFYGQNTKLSPFIGKLLSCSILWCLFLNFTKFVILETLSILDLALSGVKDIETLNARTPGDSPNYIKVSASTDN